MAGKTSQFFGGKKRKGLKIHDISIRFVKVLLKLHLTLVLQKEFGVGLWLFVFLLGISTKVFWGKKNYRPHRLPSSSYRFVVFSLRA